MGNSNSTEAFNNLIKQLEYLDMKNSNRNSSNSYNSHKKDPYFDIYGNMKINDLLYNIKASLNECEKSLNSILNSANYSSGSIFKEKEIDNYIKKLIFWKNKNQNNNYYFEKTMQLLNKIKSKDLDIYESKMDIESTSSNFSNPQGKGEHQKQKLINKQDLIQVQELALLNDNFGRALASLECYANRYTNIKTNIFNYYNMFDFGNTQSINELQKKAFVQTKIFNLAFEDYIKKYKYYNAPENITLSEIANLVNNWMSVVPEEHRFIYQGMINEINLLNNSVFDNKFDSYAKKYKDAKMDPKKISSFAPGVYYYNQQRCNEAKNKFLEEGKLTSHLNINQSYKNDKNAEALYLIIQNNNRNVQEAEEYKDPK